MKRCISLLLALCIVFSFIPVPVYASEDVAREFYSEKTISDFNGDNQTTTDTLGSIDACYSNNILYSEEATLLQNTLTAYDYNVKLVADTFRYLDEIYINKYPQLGLRFTYGGEDEKRILTDLVLAITEGCSTDRQKADAINAWVRRNIAYVDTYPFPIDTFYMRGGVCLGQAILMTALFRLAGIPATWGDGWRGDLKNLTANQVITQDEGHAWCFAYVDGEWELYDPLWLEQATKDRGFIAETFYFAMVEGITPVYDTDVMPPYTNTEPSWYHNGKFYAYRSYIVNWSICLNMVGKNNGSEICYVDPSRDISSLGGNEALCDGWIWYGFTTKMYMYENGVAAAGVVRKENGKDYYFTSQQGYAFEILCSPDEYSIVNGFFAVKPGYTGTPLKPTCNIDPNEITIVWESDNPSVTVDSNGIVTANEPGMAGITAHFYRNWDGAYLGSNCFYWLMVTDADRTPDYSDSYTDHEHQYTAIQREATNKYCPYVLYTCTVGDCAHSYVDLDDSSTHNWSEATCTTPKTCSSCGYTEGNPLGHKEQSFPGKAASCAETGLSEGKQCTVCGTITVAQQKIAVKAHNFQNGKCTVCGGVDSDYTAPSEPSETTAPTVTGVNRLAGSNRYGTSLAVADQLKTYMGVEKFNNIVVACGNDYADALSGSYLANKKGAPILLVNKNNLKSLDDVVSYIVKNLASGGKVYILGGTSAIPAELDTRLQQESIDSKRLAGSGRYDTNLLILKEAGVNAGDEILICTGNDYADALSASATGKPILLVNKNLNKLRDDQKEFLAGIKSSKLYIIGGTSAVSENIAGEVAAYGTAKRLAGSGRYETSILIAREFFKYPTSLVLAYGHNFPDGLCGGSLGYCLNAPIILTRDKTVTYAVAYAKENGITKGFVLGGTSVLSQDAVNKVFG